jgi:ketosteroid isomerase-like protein
MSIFEQQITELEHQWATAWQSADLAALDRILAPDFTLASSRSTGELLTKAQYIQTTKDLVRGQGYAFERLLIRGYRDVAVASSLFRQEATFDGEDWSGTFLLTDVWARTGESWQVVARHATKLPKA